MQQRWHHYNVAFVDENVDTKELWIFLVENVVTNRLLISLLKRWQLYMYEKRKWFEFIKITLTLIFHPYHFCGSNFWCYLFRVKMKILTHLPISGLGLVVQVLRNTNCLSKDISIIRMFPMYENVSVIRSSGFNGSEELTEIVEHRGPVITYIMCISKMSIFLMSIPH